jgi:hypothetical protein
MRVHLTRPETTMMAPPLSLFDPPAPRPHARRLALRTRATPGRLRRHLMALRVRRVVLRSLP